jgi:hypothetical protein
MLAAVQTVIFVEERISAMDSGEQNGPTLPSQLTVDDVDVEFLPLIYEIIRRYESLTICVRKMQMMQVYQL